jgi:signal peptidase II
LFLIAVAVAVVIVDQLTKALISGYMQVGESLPIIPGILHITHVQNAGAAFGMMQNRRPLFLIAAFVIISVIAIFYRRIKEEGILPVTAVGLLLGGAIGNLIDRVMAGTVTDFIDFRIWPVFNIADCAIVIGVIALGYFAIRSSNNESNKESDKDKNCKENPQRNTIENASIGTGQ